MHRKQSTHATSTDLESRSVDHPTKFDRTLFLFALMEEKISILTCGFLIG